jgi:WD40 repeat protein
MRQADHTLYEALLAGEFCYVLNARQMGKSSLRVTVMQRLQAEGFACAALDVTKIGSQNLSADQWYASLMGSLVQSFGLSRDFNLRAWWRDRAFLSPVQRLNEFVETILLQQIQQRLVFFIDEIDSLLSLNFPMDDFFAWIRFIYNHRAENANLQRLSIVLLGVTTPSDLIQDKSRTPFNIGKSIPLQGFQLQDATPLWQGLAEVAYHPQAVLKAILDWTDGQPFLTQKLCRLVQQHATVITANTETTFIANLVQDRVICNWDAQDEPEHLKTIRNRLLRNENQAGRLLGLYQQVLQHGSILADDSPEQMELRLTGLVVQQDGHLRSHNRIYQAVFDVAWVEQHLAALRPYAAAFQSWLKLPDDPSTLLRGQQLQAALTWATGKSLSNTDYQFLKASQEQANHDVQLTLTAERKAKEAAELANRILANAQQRAGLMIRDTLVVLGCVSVGMVVAIATLVRTHQTLQNTQTSLSLEQMGVQTLQQFPVDQITALLKSLDAAHQLQRVVNPQQPLSTYPTTKPWFVLQSILDQIQAQNTWQTAQGQLIKGHWSPDGQTIFTAGSDGTLREWALSGQHRQTFKAHKAGITRFLVSPSSQRLVTVGADNTINVWTRSGQSIITLHPKLGKIQGLRIDGQGKYFICVGENDTIKLWSIAGEPLLSFRTGQGQVLSLAISHQGDEIAAAGIDGTLKRWTIDGQLLQAWNTNPLNGQVNRIDYHPNGQSLLSVSESGLVQIWSPAGQSLNQWRASQAPVYDVSISPDGQTIATVSEDRAVRLWDMQGTLLSTLQDRSGLVTSVSFHPHQPLLLTTTLTDGLTLWNLRSPRQAVWNTQHQSTWGLDVRPDAIATGGADGYVRIWTPEGKRLQALSGDTGINAVSFSPDRQHLLAANEAGVTLWDMQGSKAMPNPLSVKTQQGRVNSVSWHPTQATWISGGDDGTLKRWDVHGKLLSTIQASTLPLWSVGFSPQGEQIATTGRDGQVRLWSLTGALLNTLTNPTQSTGWVSSLSYHPQGNRLASAGKDGWIYVWTLQDGGSQSFQSHLSGILNIVFSPDGERLAAAGQDGSIRVWTTMGQPLAQFQGHQGAVYTLRWDSTGNQLYSVGEDGTLRTWQLSNLSSMIHQGCQWLSNYLALHPKQSPGCS